MLVVMYFSVRTSQEFGTFVLKLYIPFIYIFICVETSSLQNKSKASYDRRPWPYVPDPGKVGSLVGLGSPFFYIYLYFYLPGNSWIITMKYVILFFFIFPIEIEIMEAVVILFYF